MNWSKAALYFAGALVAIGPVSLRVLTRPDPPRHDLETGSVQEGRKLFTHEFVPNDPLCPKGDGLGPVFNANSCAVCHHQSGVGGSGGNEHNVTTFVVRGSNIQGVIHTFATTREFQETLGNVNPGFPARSIDPAALAALIKSRGLPPSASATVNLSQRNTPALFGARLIDEIPDRVIIAAERGQELRWGLASSETDKLPVGRVLRLPGNRVGKFGWKAQSASLFDFVQAACANELGLGNPGQVQPASLTRRAYQAPGLDLTTEQCRQITTFVAALDRPIERMPGDLKIQKDANEGKDLFTRMGCADCHTPALGAVEGIYSDLLLHRMGPDLTGTNSYYSEPVQSIASASSPGADEWRTPPLWGVADSAPYLHDGRAETLADAIKMHGGQAQMAAENFQRLPPARQAAVIQFLNTLRAP